MTDDPELRSQRGVYSISVASELTGIPPQTLRLYEQRGLLTPSRTEGGTRRYSEDDLKRLRRVAQLVEAGVNLAGIERILTLDPLPHTSRRRGSAIGRRENPGSSPDRTQPLLPIDFGATEKRTHDYIRHGTTNLFAALQVGSGEIYGECHPTRDGAQFLAFLKLR